MKLFFVWKACDELSVRKIVPFAPSPLSPSLLLSIIFTFQPLPHRPSLFLHLFFQIVSRISKSSSPLATLRNKSELRAHLDLGSTEVGTQLRSISCIIELWNVSFSSLLQNAKTTLGNRSWGRKEDKVRKLTKNGKKKDFIVWQKMFLRRVLRQIIFLSRL